ncbi:hypothetical protein [Paenibacillus alkalitolerans]|uniref:hypothetical protein n=1 Tax=Paenibacillus alkalitolerans TaxID=2799335 RepID=UPI0018F58CE1|nr:hypothetical protein [Paenibacillus alkalitolerans]
MTARRTRLDRYERGIVTHLSKRYGYTLSDARELVIAYLPVIEKLGRYDNSGDHADRLHQARRNGLTPELWLHRINMIDAGASRDASLRKAQLN